VNSWSECGCAWSIISVLDWQTSNSKQLMKIIVGNAYQRAAAQAMYVFSADIIFLCLSVFQVLSYHASATEEETQKLQVTAVN